MDLLDAKPKRKTKASPWQGRVKFASAFEDKKRRYRKDLQPLNEAQRELALRFLPLARKLAKPLKLSFRQWRDEFESAACLALVEAARSFDPTKNIRFATFARFRIRGALVDVGRLMGINGWEDEPEDSPSLITLTPYIEEHHKVLVAVLPPPVYAEVDDIDTVEALLSRLPRQHAAICRLYYLFGKTQMEIAEGMGCSQAEVTRLHKKALELLAEPYDIDGTLHETKLRTDKPKNRTPQFTASTTYHYMSVEVALS